MRIPQKAIPWIRLSVLIVFTVASLIFYGVFYVAGGGRLPLVAPTPYQVVFQSPINKNLVNQSEVTLNGVSVGRVQDIEVVNGVAMVTAGFDTRPEVAPLHEGARAAIKTKTLINETYIDVTDGNGPEIPDGTVLAPGNVQAPVDTDEVVRALPAQTRRELGGALQSLDLATKDNQSGISQTIGSLGEPTNYVPAAFKALADQEVALRQLSSNTARVLDAFDTRQGQIAELVGNAERVTRVTAGSKDDLSNVIRKLTPTLRTAQDASDDLSRLGFALQPVSENLLKSAKPLNAALAELPATSRDLRELLPALDSTLTKLPPTLKKVPPFASDVRRFAPVLGNFLGEANPILSYLKACGPNASKFAQNLGLSLNRASPNGAIGGVNPIFGFDSISIPSLLPLPSPPFPSTFNPIPANGQFSYQVGNSPTQAKIAQGPMGPMIKGNPNDNTQCATPLIPYTK